jgi:hypothetical protein
MGTTSGRTVTLIDVGTGRPAQVKADSAYEMAVDGDLGTGRYVLPESFAIAMTRPGGDEVFVRSLDEMTNAVLAGYSVAGDAARFRSEKPLAPEQTQSPADALAMGALGWMIAVMLFALGVAAARNVGRTLGRTTTRDVRGRLRKTTARLVQAVLIATGLGAAISARVAASPRVVDPDAGLYSAIFLAVLCAATWGVTAWVTWLVWPEAFRPPEPTGKTFGLTKDDFRQEAASRPSILAITEEDLEKARHLDDANNWKAEDFARLAQR